MNTFWSKNTAIGFLIFSNVATALYSAHIIPDGKSTSPSPIAVVTKEAKDPLETYRKGVVAKVLAKNNPNLERCYNQFLETGAPGDEGAVVVHWMIDQQGHVQSPKLVTTDINNDYLVNCVMDQLKALSFTPPPREMLVAHRFNFYKRALSHVAFE